MSEVGVCVWKQRNLIGDVCVFWNPGLEVLLGCGLAYGLCVRRLLGAGGSEPVYEVVIVYHWSVFVFRPLLGMCM